MHLQLAQIPMNPTLALVTQDILEMVSHVSVSNLSNDFIIFVVWTSGNLNAFPLFKLG